MTTAKVTIDRDVCVGHGRCYSLAPDVYISDDEGFSELVDGAAVEGDALVQQALLGAQTCPEKAVAVSLD